MTRRELDFIGVPAWILALVALGLLVAVLYLYRRERGLVPVWVGRFLLGLRIALVVLLLLLFLEALLRHIRETSQRGELFFVLDGSKSMALRDEFRPSSQMLREAKAFGFSREEMKSGLEELKSLNRLELACKILGGGSFANTGAVESRKDQTSPLSLLAQRFQISAVELGKEIREVTRDVAGNLLPAAPDGDWTDLGQPILDEVSSKDRELLAGVVLISDGRHNRGHRPEEVMRSLGAMKIPLFVLSCGAEVAPRDIRIVEIDATGKVYGGDEIKVDVTIESMGMGALSIPLRIADGENTLKEVTAEIPAGTGITHVPVSFNAPEGGASGRRKFTVSFPSQTGEVTAVNNSRDFWVSILTEKARILLLDGSPRWEYRYLKNTLGRDENVDLDSFLVTRPPDRRLPQGFPRERDELFQYDVLMLGDVEASVFSSEELEAIRDFVAARGGSLVLIAGIRAMPYDYAETVLEDLLPVRLLRRRPPEGEGAFLASAGFTLRLTADGERSSITRLVPGRESNRELWTYLPMMYWFSPVQEAKLQATVLASLPGEIAGRALSNQEDGADPPLREPKELTEPLKKNGETSLSPPNEPFPSATPAEPERRGPILATLLFGAGRVFYAGIDSTWRWRYITGDLYFARFWGQVIRWAASERLPAGDDHVRLGTDELRYDIPAKVTVSAIVQLAEGKPLENATIDAVMRHQKSGRIDRIRLQPIPQSGGLYRGTIEIGSGRSKEALGEHRITLEIPAIPGYAGRDDKASVSFLVEEPPSREAADLTRDRALLEEMVREAGPGGSYLPIDRVGELPSLIPDRTIRKEEVTTTEQWVLAWPLLILFAALITAEWFIRKRFDLI